MLVHAGFAIQKMTEKEAQENLALMQAEVQKAADKMVQQSIPQQPVQSGTTVDVEQLVEQRVEELRESTIRAARREAMTQIDRALESYTMEARVRAKQEADRIQAQALEQARAQSDALRRQVLEDARQEADHLKAQAAKRAAELEKKQRETLAQMERETSRKRSELIRKAQDEVERQRQEIMVRAKTEAEIYRQEALEKAQREVAAIQAAAERQLRQLQQLQLQSSRSLNPDYTMAEPQNEALFDEENSSVFALKPQAEQESADLGQMLQQAKDLKELHDILDRIEHK